MPRKKHAQTQPANGQATAKVTTEPPNRRPKQEHLPTLEPPRITALDEATEAYQDVKDRRMKLTEKEVAATAALIGLMQQHQLNAYKTSDGECTVTLEEEAKVKVKRAGYGDGEP